MPAIKPIKRIEQLAPLSREHHDALLFVWKIRQGVKNETSPAQISSYVQWFWNNFLQPHFSKEEHLLLAHLPATDELGQRIRAEHHIIQQMIANSLSISTLGILADKINDHVRFEERQFFPYIEQNLSSEQLDSIFKLLDLQSHCLDKWPDEFWLKKA